MRSVQLSAAALGAALALSGCLVRGPQRWPGPMRPEVDPLPPGDSAQHLPGPEEVGVVRHADPVQIRAAGTFSGRSMEFYDKRARLTAGGAVIVSPGGRAEVLWPGGTSIVMFDQAVGWVGSPSRGEPIFEFTDVDSARLELQQGDQVRLLGGSILSGSSGPYVLTHDPDGTLTVHNQSKGGVQLSFREETFTLEPGQAVRIPLLSSGGAPYVDDPDLERFSGQGFAVRVQGALACAEEGDGVRVRAEAPGVERSARALGVRVKLEQGDSVLFGPLRPASTTPVAPAPAPDAPAKAGER